MPLLAARPCANRNLRVSRSPSSTSWERQHPATVPAVDYGVPSRTCAGASGQTLFVVGRPLPLRLAACSSADAHTQHACSTSPPHVDVVYVIWGLPNYFCTAQASNQATRRGLDFSSWFIDPLGGCLTIACGCDAAQSGEPPSYWNDDGSTRAWHGTVNRVAEKQGALLNSGSAVWVWQLH